MYVDVGDVVGVWVGVGEYHVPVGVDVNVCVGSDVKVEVGVLVDV